MKNFFLIVNKDKDKDMHTAMKLKKYIIERGGMCYITSINKHHDSNDNSYIYTNPDDVPDNTDAILVLGGDGTMILAARDLAKLDIPILGINLGHLGFLAEVDEQDMEGTIDKLFQEEYHIESRMMLEGQLSGNDKKIVALNDIVVGRSGSMRVIDYNIYVDDILLNKYRADGIIISTPTGSTAYNMSAGGPIVEPGSNIIVLTPICAHTLNTRSIVLSPDSKIEIEICEDRHVDSEGDGRKAYFDGNTSVVLNTGDRLLVKKSKQDTKIIKLRNRSFVKILQKKMIEE